MTRMSTFIMFKASLPTLGNFISSVSYKSTVIRSSTVLLKVWVAAPAGKNVGLFKKEKFSARFCKGVCLFCEECEDVWLWVSSGP